MIQKYPKIEGHFDPLTRPMTILSVGHPERWKHTLARIISPLFADPQAQTSIAYWLIDVPPDNGTYNVARAYNNALWECESPVVVFSTGDSIIYPLLLWRACETHRETLLPVVAMRADETGEGSLEVVANDHAIGDFMLVPREWAIEAGGWDERMISWGFVDYAFCAQLERIGYPPIVLGQRLQDRVYHLWHPRRDDAWYREQNRSNERIFRNEPAWMKGDFMAGRVAAEVNA